MCRFRSTNGPHRVALVTAVGVLGAFFAARANAGETPELGYAFKMRWHRGAPSFAWEKYPRPEQQRPIVYSGSMSPRGTLILTLPFWAKSLPDGRRLTLRSEDVDVTSRLSLAQLVHTAPDGTVRTISPKKMPRLEVVYAPDMPAEVALPEQKICMLLFKVGKARDKWAPGTWQVTLRFSARNMNVSLRNQGAPANPDPQSPSDSVLFSFSFLARDVDDDADRDNLLLYQYEDARSRDQKEALKVADQLLQYHPRDAYVLYQKAQMLANLERYGEAANVLRQMLSYIEDGTIKGSYTSLGIDRMTREEAREWLAQRAEWWEDMARKQTAQPKTDGQPGADKPSSNALQ